MIQLSFPKQDFKQISFDVYWIQTNRQTPKNKDVREFPDTVIFTGENKMSYLQFMQSII